MELDGQSAIIVLDNGGCVFHPNVTTVSIIVTADSKENPGIGHVGVEYAPPPFQAREQDHIQACLRPRDRFWDIPVPIIDPAFDNLFVPQPSWSPSTTQQLRKLLAAPYLPPNDWTPRSEAYFVFPLAQGTPGKQCGLAATGVYQPSLRSPWLAACFGLR
ncbi:hypothetical protein, partial [Thiolapillus sp.]